LRLPQRRELLTDLATPTQPRAQPRADARTRLDQAHDEATRMLARPELALAIHLAPFHQLLAPLEARSARNGRQLDRDRVVGQRSVERPADQHAKATLSLLDLRLD